MAEQIQRKLLSSEDSDFWRQAYLDAFVDTACEFYARHIASRRQYSDGTHYEGYPWDCMPSRKRIGIGRLRLEVARHAEVLVMADDHSREKILGAPMWPFAPRSVAVFEAERLWESLPNLPEDIYVFDSSVAWTVVLTHEHDDRRRICWAVGLES